MNYDYAAMAVGFIILGIYFLRPKFQDMSVMLFQVMVVCVLISCVTRVGLSMLISADEELISIGNLYWIESIYWFSIYLSLIIYYRYILNLVRKTNISIGEKVIFWGAIGINVVLIFTTRFNHLCFYYIQGEGFITGPYFKVLNITALIVMLATLYVASIHRNQLVRVQKMAIIAYYIVAIISIVFEEFMSDMNMMSFGMILYLLVLYASIQNPENYVEHELECFNSEALLSVSSSNGNKKRTAIIFRLDGYAYVSQRLGIKVAQKLEHQVSSHLIELCGFKRVFHTGECEFVLWLPQHIERIEKIVNEISKEYHDNRTMETLNISLKPMLFGVNYPLMEGKPEDLLDVLTFVRQMKVDYQSDVIKYVNKEFVEKKRHKERIEQAIKRNVKANSFDVSYQPIYDMVNNKIIGAEALVRLEDAEIGKVSPEEFIPIAEEIGYIIKIDEIVFTKVCQLCQELKRQQLEILRIQVKLPNVEVFHENLADKLILMLEEYQVDPTLVGFEVSETEEMESNPNLRKNLSKLDCVGCETILDDYGSGYSNLNYLLDERIRTIRIDKEILDKASQDDKARRIMEHLVGSIGRLGYKVLSEGVERQEQVDMLRQMGVNYMQGHYFAYPLTAEEFIEALQKN